MLIIVTLRYVCMYTNIPLTKHLYSETSQLGTDLTNYMQLVAIALICM